MDYTIIGFEGEKKYELAAQFAHVLLVTLAAQSMLIKDIEIKHSASSCHDLRT